jgi:DNA polymerase bacteriophage-type
VPPALSGSASVPPALSIDFETASTVDLRKTGAHAYARHPDTQILCMSYAFEGEPVLRWKPGEPFPARIADHVARRYPVHGWNVGFEWLIWNHVLLRSSYVPPRGIVAPTIPPLELDQLRDTMARAAYWGLPLSLDQAGPAAGISLVKDKDGHKLMMRMNKPRGYDKATGAPIWWHETDPAKLDRLQDYCDQDVRVEAAIAAILPPLPDTEQEFWEIDQRINAHGVALDTLLIEKLKALASDAKLDANSYLEILTGGEVKTTTDVKGLLAFVKSIGYPHDDLGKETIKRRLADDDLSDLEREVLEVRADAAKTSTAKLDAMLRAAWDDGDGPRVRGMLQFYGAFRTGRWAGRLVQLQNLPRGTVKKIDEAITAVEAGMPADLLEAFFGPILGLVSSAIRGCLVASPGHELVVADFSQIEARVVAWLAEQQDILDVFESGEDVYVYTARLNGSTDRQLGKVLVLACGFGMSGKKFRDTAATYGLKLTEEQAEKAVKKWRRANSKIVQFWWDCDNAAKNVIANAAKGNSTTVKVGPVEFGMWQGHLLIRLPSGRKLVYRDAELRTDQTGRPGITYMGVDQYTRQWKRIRTYGGKIVENITQAVARDIMADATREAVMTGIPVELLVHDEMVAEAPIGQGASDLALLLQIMRTRPTWAPGLPVDAAGWHGPRYKK